MSSTLKKLSLLALAGLANLALQGQTLTDVDVGSPSQPGSTTATTDASGGKVYTVVGGGSDIWNTSDNFHYAYLKVTGDFDYIMKVESLVGNSGDGGWSKVELMARVEETAGAGPQGPDPMIANMTTRASSDTANGAPAGVNYLGPQWRVNRGGNADWRTPSPVIRPSMPTNWVRLERVGSVFYMYHSNDGKAWSMYGPYDPQGFDTAGSFPIGADNSTAFPGSNETGGTTTAPWPNTIFLGIAVTAHSDPDITTAVVSNFKPYTPVPITITKQPPATVAVEENTLLTLSVAATGDPLHYQWRKDGTPVPTNGLGTTFTIAHVKQSDAGTYTVRFFGGGKEVISANAVVTVTPDATSPTLLGAKGKAGLTGVVLSFSEVLNQASAETIANYTISSASGSLAVTAAALSADGTQVTLTTAQQTVGTKYTVTVNKVTDVAKAANVIAAGSKAAFFPAGKITQDASGFIVFEAENYDRNLDGLWIRNTTRGTPSGGVSMVCPSGGSESASQLEYDVDFKKTGTHIIWYRASANDGSSDSAWFHIDGDRDPNRVDANQDSMTGFSGQTDFVWLSQPQDGGGQFTFDVATAGPHIIGLARRENNAYFDKFIITTDPSYQPTGFGPPETRAGAPAAPTVTLTTPTEGQKFPTGTSITLTANPTPAAGVDVAKVEFAANGTTLGTATTAPFTYTWSSAAEGSYTVTATVTDEVGGVATSPAVHIKVGNPPPLIYFVTADPGPLTFAGDLAVQQHLKNRGFDVQLARGSDVPVDGSTALGASLILQSSSLGSGTVEANGVSKFRSLGIPAMVWESSNEDGFSFQAANGTTTAGQTQINIVDATSPLAAGLPKGLVTVTTGPETFSQGTPENAHIVATLADDPTQAVLYYYDKGEKGYNGFVMPARRVFFFFQDNTASVANDNGWKLFDTAVDWLVGTQPSAPQPVLSVTRAGASLTITWTNGGTLQSTSSLTPPITWNNETGAGSFSTSATGPTKFYRVTR